MYMDKGVGFVARPPSRVLERKGLFKKASNMNYCPTFHLNSDIAPSITYVRYYTTSYLCNTQPTHGDHPAESVRSQSCCVRATVDHTATTMTNNSDACLEDKATTYSALRIWRHSNNLSSQYECMCGVYQHATHTPNYFVSDLM